jgi:Ca2+-binding EF-hand superfamily protein
MLHDTQEFRAYYSEVWRDHLKKNLNLDQMTRMFRQLDEDGDGQVSAQEFCHVLRSVSGDHYFDTGDSPSAGGVSVSRTSAAGTAAATAADGQFTDVDISRIVSLTVRPSLSASVKWCLPLQDTNRDGAIQFEEFLALINHFSDPDSNRPPKDWAPETSRVMSLVWFVVVPMVSSSAVQIAGILIRKLLRSCLPSPMEHIMAFGIMPSSFRPSMVCCLLRLTVQPVLTFDSQLAPLSKRHDLSLSSKLTPVLGRLDALRSSLRAFALLTLDRYAARA